MDNPLYDVHKLTLEQLNVRLNEITQRLNQAYTYRVNSNLIPQLENLLNEVQFEMLNRQAKLEFEMQLSQFPETIDSEASNVKVKNNTNPFRKNIKQNKFQG